MKRLSRISIFFFLLLAIGCSSQTEPPTSLPIAATIENTETPKPTSTPTTSFSPTPEQVTIEFPEWVKNPETQILLLPVTEYDSEFISHYKGLSLFNAGTSERLDIQYTNQLGDYFWMPNGSGFGFLPKQSQEVIFFSIKEETITTIPMPNEVFRFINQEDSLPQPIQVSSSEFGSPEFLFLPYWALLSSDKNYFIYHDDYHDRTSTKIFSISSSELIEISDPDDKYQDLYTEWAPDSHLLAIAEVDQSPRLFNSFDNLPVFELRIYDVLSRQLIFTYTDVTFPKWSPDGTKFLFQKWKGSNNFYWYGESPPCIFDTISGETICFSELIINDKVNITSVEWSPDQSMISFVYMNYAAKEGEQVGSFCTIQLSLKEKTCLLSQSDLEGQNVVEYLWSPDSNYISFFYDESNPISDYRTDPKLGIANIKTGEYFYTSIPINDTQWLGLWRPSPNP